MGRVLADDEDFLPESNSHSGKQDGLYVTAHINGMRVNCLIDTGASLTVIHPDKYYRIPAEGRPPLQSMDSHLRMADGGRLPVIGKVNLTLDFGQGVSIKQDLIVAEVEAPLVLGYDFQFVNKCLVDVGHTCIYIQEQRFNCLLESRMHSIFRIVIHDTVIIPPRHEVIVAGKVKGGKPSCEEMVTEPNEEFQSCKELMVAKALIKVDEFVPIRLVNFSSETKTVQADTVVATGQPVSGVVEIESRNDQDTCGHINKVAHGVDKTDTEIPAHLEDLWERSKDELDEAQQLEVKSLLIDNASTFAKSKSDLGTTNLVQHKIFTGDAAPIKQPPRRVPLASREVTNREVDQMLEIGTVRPSTSPWSSPVVLVKKKDGSVRFCVDYRRLNEISRKDSYPLPRIDDSLDTLSGSEWFSTLDLASGYWQVKMHPDDAEKTAFSTPKGLFEFTVMPFGLVNAPATFERLMEVTLSGLHWQTCLIYIDDIIVFGPDFRTHISRLSEVLNRIRKAGLKLSPKKCKLLHSKVEFLGHVVSREGISTDPSKVKAIQDWPIPLDLTGVRSFLGTCSYYRRFIKGYANIAKPLHQLAEKNRKFFWSPECQEAFDQLKLELSQSPILGYPCEKGMYILDTDASGYGIGAVLSQIQSEEERVITYHSRSLTKAERNYCVTRRELLAVVDAIKHCHHYLYGREFIVRTDHASLNWLMRFKNPEGQIARWIQILGTYNFKIEHRMGRKHGNADGLSRKPPCSPCTYCDRKESKDLLTEGSGISRMVRALTYDKLVPTDISNSDLLVESWSPEQLHQWQAEDVHLKKVFCWKEADLRPNWSDIEKEGPEIRSLWCHWETFKFVNNVIYRVMETDERSVSLKQLVAPSAIRQEIFKHLHSHRTGGHPGNQRSRTAIQSRFWWPNMRSDISLWCQTCEPCQFRKQAKKKKVPLKQSPVGAPMERMAIDILSLPTITEDGNTCILVVCDYFTKWVQAIALPDHTAYTVADALVVEVFLKFGTPLVLHSDQGTEFQSELMKEICRLLEIKQTRTSPYHPQSDGLVERFNRTLLDMLSKVCAENPTTWDHHLPYVMCAYRSTQHSSTGCSPNMLMLGREIALPIDLMLGQHDEDYPYTCSIEYVEWIKGSMRENFELVRNRLERVAETQKKHYDKRAELRKFDIGDWVLRVYPPNMSKNKLNYRHIGPFLVTKKLGEVNYSIQKSRNSVPITVHVNDLKQYFGENMPVNWLPNTHDLDESNINEPLPDIHDLENDLDPDLDTDDIPSVMHEMPPERKSHRTRKPPQRFGWDDE